MNHDVSEYVTVDQLTDAELSAEIARRESDLEILFDELQERRTAKAREHRAVLVMCGYTIDHASGMVLGDHFSEHTERRQMEALEQGKERSLKHGRGARGLIGRITSAILLRMPA